MSEWKNININTNLIEYSTDFSTLIKCPKTSAYNGYSFWITNKLVHDGRNNASVSIGYTDEFKFKLIKYGKGKYNKNKKIEEIEINVAQFEEIFGIINDNIKEAKTIYKMDMFETHKPEQIEAKNVEVDEDLKDD